MNHWVQSKLLRPKAKPRACVNPQIRSFITKQNGAFHFHSLNPDINYELKAEHQGTQSGSKTLSSFDGRKSAVINLKVGK